MIVVFDTTVIYSDVHASRRLTRDVLEGAAAGNWSVVVPGVVFEEAVRQYPTRLRKALSDIGRAIGNERTNLQALGLSVPQPPEAEADDLIAAYPTELRRTLSQPGCEIADAPSETEIVGSWAATRRKPFKEDGTGACDAFVWLTVLDQAENDDVLLVSANSEDFADPADSRQLAPELLGDLDRRGIDRATVRRVHNIHQLLVELITPEQRALRRAQAILDDPRRRAHLVASISFNASWTPGRWDSLSDWELGAEVEDFRLIAFDVDDLTLESAEENGDGSLTMLLRGSGTGTFDFHVEKGEAIHAAEDGPIEIEDWDWNEWYVWARASLNALAEIDVRTRDDQEFEISIEALEPA